MSRIDYVLGNDTHERIREPLQAGHARVTEPGAFASFVGKMVLEVQNGELLSEYELMEVDPSKYEADAEVAAVIEEAVAPYKERSTKYWATLKHLVPLLCRGEPDGQLYHGCFMWKNDVDIALSNGFRFSPPIVPGENGVAPIAR